MWLKGKNTQSLSYSPLSTLDSGSSEIHTHSHLLRTLIAITYQTKHIIYIMNAVLSQGNNLQKSRVFRFADTLSKYRIQIIFHSDDTLFLFPLVFRYFLSAWILAFCVGFPFSWKFFSFSWSFSITFTKEYVNIHISELLKNSKHGDVMPHKRLNQDKYERRNKTGK